MERVLYNDFGSAIATEGQRCFCPPPEPGTGYARGWRGRAVV